MDLKPGTRIKSYTLERQLGKGASGEVWKAYDETKTVAIKFMNENLMTSASASKHRERLIREVESLRRLQHPNIPTLYDYDLDFRRPYIAMRFVGGDSYDRLISSGDMIKIPLERRLEMIRDIAFALTAAHEAGIIHRDIKPANMTGIENPYLLDFSISLESENVEHTQRFVGTTLYMSADGVADRLSDNYSFAVVVYEILFGRHPIYQLGDSLFNQFIAEMRIQNRQWTFPSTIPQSQIPADLRAADFRRLDEIFERAMGSRETRYTDLREFVRELRWAVLPQQRALEEARIASAPISPAPASPPPAAPPPPPAPEPVSTEESDFLNKAFVNLPAVQIEPPAPDIELEQTSLEHKTVPYDYEAKQRVPVADPPSDAPQIRFSQPPGEAEVPAEPAEPAPAAPAPTFAGPDDRTMMEIRIPRQEVPTPDTPPVEAAPPAAPPPVVGMNDRTMMDIRMPSRQPPPTPPSSDATMMEIPAVRGAPPAPQENFTQLEAQPPRDAAAPPPASEENFTLLESQAAKPRQQPQPDYTMMEVQGARRAPAADNFTQMEMQTPAASREGIPNPMQGDNFTLLEMRSIAPDGTPVPGRRGSQRLLIAAAVIIVLVIVAAVVILALTGAGTV